MAVLQFPKKLQAKASLIIVLIVGGAAGWVH